MCALNMLRQAVEEQGFRLEERKKGRGGIERFAVLGDELVAEGGFFPGSTHVRKWIELSPEVVLSPEEERSRQLFDALTAPLDPGSYLMVHYFTLPATKEALNVDVPPPATPLGFLLWQTGFRWYKDWYIAEGAREGGQKLQANLPVDEETREKRESEMADELRAYLEAEPERERCQKLAERVLDGL